ncbi:MAG: ClcB-like voltage-gated chloride channel protein [Steroidobacterales bacterium]
MNSAVRALSQGVRSLALRAQQLARAGITLLKHEELTAIIFWAALVGICGALASVAFRASVSLVQRLLTGRDAGLGLVETAASLQWWTRMTVPTIGGAIAGLLLWGGHRLLRRPRSVDYMEAVAVGNGQLSGLSALIQATSSFFTIGSGGSIGREGPMVQMAATIASKIGQWAQAPVPRLRLLVACGASAGIAAAYNAPIAGALFVAEVVMGSIAMESFGPLIVASVVSDAVTRHFLGVGPVYQVPQLNFGAGWELALYGVLGVALGHAAPPYLALLDRARVWFRGLRLPAYVCMALGGAIVGSISVALPQVWGNGYSVVNEILHGQIALGLLGLILIAKLVSTCASVGSGAVGGILTPTLFMGAAFGELFGGATHLVWTHSSSDIAAYAVVGMGSFLAATTHAPLTSILLMFEMTLDYDLVLPLMLACVTGHYVARIYRHGESVYTRSLHAAGPGREEEWRLKTVAALMRPPVQVLQRDQTVGAALAAIPHNPRGPAYVIDLQNQLVGALDVANLRHRLRAGELADSTPIAAVMQIAPPALSAQAHLGDALEVFLAHRCKRLPVVSGQWSPVVLGEVSRHDLLLALQDRMAERR